ncbi:glycine-rich cell wall structural protein 1.0-like [Oryza glaberrima]|uniref:glycine-rich cell wall structural protein 1.0-like n=1 Tax=Oryza glaberrima TaxID=4538 RepID=UPI00224C35D1|nr:glycine-rich cell wall structural protein 1.0-like [Oryza glaberrima]
MGEMVRGGNSELLRGDQRRQGRRAGGSRPQGGSGWQGAALGGAGGSGTPVGKGRWWLAGQGRQRLVRGAGGWLRRAGAGGSGEGCRWRIAGAGRRRKRGVAAAHGRGAAAAGRRRAAAGRRRAAATRTPEVEGGGSTATAP